MAVTYKEWEFMPGKQIPVLHKVVYGHRDDDEGLFQWQVSYKEHVVRAWLKENCQHNYYTSPGYEHNKYVQFECDEEATLFALRWAK